jgi:hypothetical protein
MRHFLVVLLVLALSSCGGGPGLDAAAEDGGQRDAPLDAAPADSGPGDALSADSGGASDASADAAPDAAGDAGIAEVGLLGGACGELDDVELVGSMAFLFRSTIDFPLGFDEAEDTVRLSDGAQEILREGTAGGSSGLSEAFSFEILHRCEGAALVKSETEIVYVRPDTARTDYLAEIDGHRIGVSVTRAVGFPRDAAYTTEQAGILLERKLMDILESTANVSPEDAWRKQILHVIAYGSMHAESFVMAWEATPLVLRADTILWVTVSDGDDAFLY